MPEPIATWNPQTQLWETNQANLFSERQEPYSETWPTSGMTRNGRLLPLAMSAHRTGESECSSLLPTPRAEEFGSGSYATHANGTPKSGKTLTQSVKALPTPRATDGTKGGPNQRGSSGDQLLPSAVLDM